MKEDLPVENPEEFVMAAIFEERKENPDCPMAQLMAEAWESYRKDNDPETLNLVLSMARQTLAPQKSIWERIRSILRPA